MSDNDSNQRTPLSSSSSNVSGTHALSVTIESEAKEAKKDTGTPSDATASTGSETTTKEPFQHPVANNENQPVGTASESTLLETVSGDRDAAPSMPVDDESTQTSGGSVPELRKAVRETMKENKAKSEKAFVMLERMSLNFKSAMEDARSDAARISFKLMEFAQANFRSNVEFARDYASARSVPDVFNVQAAYFKRQIDLMNKHAEELRTLTSEIASKKAVQIQSRIKSQ